VLFFLVLILGYLTYQILNPFLSSISWAIVLSIIFYPVYAFLLKYIKLPSLASFLTLLIIVLVIFGPFSYLSYLLKQEADALIEYAKAGHLDLDMHEDIDSLLRGRMQLYRDLHLLNGLEPRPVLIAQLLRHRSSKEWSWILEQVHSRVLHAQDGADLQASPHDQRLGRRN